MPANWELEGFAEPRYGSGLEDGLGLYRRTFRIPEMWREGGRVCLRFEGVAYGFEAWVNGQKVGASSASAYNPHTFDVTDAISSDPGAENVLAVKVTTKPRAFRFDLYDDWSLSGIFRDVTLFSVPATHIQDVTTRTTLLEDGTAKLSVAVTVNTRGAEIRGTLFAPDGATVGEFLLPRQTESSRHEAAVEVPAPRLWTAETPALYRLRLALSVEGRSLQTIEERIGLRQVSIVDGVLLLNGRPLKLRGINHHDLDPETGRAITEDQMRRDLELMKKGNVNFVRTAHYPTHTRFLELADELGFYVLTEVSIGNGDGRALNDPAFRPNLLARVKATITRDKNHPSVVMWSIGNENRMNEGELAAGRLAKELDPTRPLCIPKTGVTFAENRDKFPEYVDVFAPHYPTSDDMRAWAATLKRPLILTEYAHAQGLAADRIESQWEIIRSSPRYAGGSIWHFHDQGILRRSKAPVDPDEYTFYAWVDKNRYYDTHQGDGADGIVYADRTPQTDFWQMRKVYSPVQILEDSAEVKPGRQEIAVTVENRHDFRALDGMRLAWALRRNGEAVQSGEVPLAASSHERERVDIPVTILPDATGEVLALELRCIDETGRQITERALRLDLAEAPRDAWLSSLPAAGELSVSETPDQVNIRHPHFSVSVARPGGELIIRDRDGRTLVSGIYPHPGRMRLMVERRGGDESRFGFWPFAKLTQLQNHEIKATRQGASVRLSVSGRYPRPNDPEQALLGGYEVEIAPNGVLTISYRYQPSGAADGNFAEAGLSVAVPRELSEFRWVGAGPYSGYPGKDRLNEFGLFHLNREDLHFHGNRRQTELALLTSAEGVGMALVTSAADVCVERDQDQTLLSHNAVISSPGNKTGGNPPEKMVEVRETPEIAGTFTLVLLGESWPEALVKRFGRPAPAKEVFRPFFHSYD